MQIREQKVEGIEKKVSINMNISWRSGTTTRSIHLPNSARQCCENIIQVNLLLYFFYFFIKTCSSPLILKILFVFKFAKYFFAEMPYNTIHHDVFFNQSLKKHSNDSRYFSRITSEKYYSEHITKR